MLRGVETLVIESGGPECRQLGLHHLNEGFQIFAGGGYIIWRQRIFALHALDSIGDPRLKEELTGRINFHSTGRLKNGLPKPFA
jgi:hypothetical protein